MLRPISLLLVLSAPVTLRAQANAPATMAGCYQVRSSESDSTRQPFGMASMFQLTDARDSNYATGGYHVLPRPPGRRRTLSVAGWRPIAGDSVVVWWNTGFTRLTLRLTVAGDTLRGIADWRNDADAFRSHVQPVMAVREDCRPARSEPPGSSTLLSRGPERTRRRTSH